MSADPVDLLVPTPRRVSRRDGRWQLGVGAPLRWHRSGSDDGRLPALLDRGLVDLRLQPTADASRADLRVLVDPASELGPEAYRLRVAPGGVDLDACDDAGAFHGICTLLQLVDRDPRGALAASAVEIVDRPDFPRRGVMLDVSRDRVPRLETLFALVEQLARWKFNELQLYVEHTFAYRDHGAVWADASPFTAQDIGRLRAFCSERHVDLVPNQQSLGHFHRWLVHERYRHLAECPEGVEHPFATRREPFSLAASRPESLAFVQGLHDELLEAFDSPYFNVGLDETFDIGLGASRDAARRRGKGRVYLDYLVALERSVAARGLRMQFWGDVILEHPELVAELPRQAVALAWGYEADHPFAERCERFAGAGLDFYVCPGTSTWLSLAGRLGNALPNLEAAARAGLETGAMGYLVTDWGDFGHWQPAPASYAPLAAGASRAWNARAPIADPARVLDRDVFASPASAGEPAAASAGELWTSMAELYRTAGAHAVNGSPLFFLLRFAAQPWPHPRIEGFTPGGLERTRARIADLGAQIARCTMTCTDAQLVASEARWVLRALDFACELGRGRLALGAHRPLSDLPRADRAALAETWAGVQADLRPLWLARSRPGGLETSLARFDFLGRLLGEGP